MTERLVYAVIKSIEDAVSSYKQLEYMKLHCMCVKTNTNFVVHDFTCSSCFAIGQKAWFIRSEKVVAGKTSIFFHYEPAPLYIVETFRELGVIHDE